MKFLRTLCIVCGLSVWVAALDREAFTITKYDLEIRLEPEQQRLGARGKLTLRNDSAQPQKNAVLQISSSLDWRSIRASDKPLQFVSQRYTSDIDHTGALSEAIVTLPVEVKPKEAVELEIGYEGTITQDATRLTQIGVPADLAKHTSWDEISPSFTAARGAGYVAWYPIATEAADFTEGNSMFQVADRWRAREAESEFHAKFAISRSDEKQAVTMICSPGQVVFESGRNQYDLPECASPRLGVVTPAFVAASFEHQSKTPLHVFYLPGHDAGVAAFSAALPSVAQFVADWFGQPQTPIVIADLADSSAAPFESGALLFAPLARDDEKLAALNLAHMLAHSAFESPRPWVHEGLAHFAEALYRANKQDGRQAALDFLGLHRATFLDTEKEVAVSAQKNPGQPLATTYDESYYRSKAAYVWWMLRDMAGDDALKQAIRSYRAADDRDPKYVERLMASATKRDLAWFFDDWVYYDRGLPDFRVAAVHAWKGEGDKQILTVTIENLGAAGAEVPVRVRFGDGEIARRIEVRAKAIATTRIEIPGTATEVMVNDGSVPESDVGNNTFEISQP